MATFNVTCGGPGPHIPASGILGTSDRQPTADVRCSSPSCVKAPDATVVNQLSLQQKAQAAYQSNAAYIASTPTQAQALAQVKTLTQQMNGLIRLVLGQYDSDS